MQLAKCLNGHFFDRDKCISCPYCGASALVKAERNNPEIAKAKTEFIRNALETGTLSEIFASGAVFDIVRQQHEQFEEIVRSGNAGILLKWFVDAYQLFCKNPTVVHLPPTVVSEEKNDARLAEMNADIFKLPNGNWAALCFMPIQSDVHDARIIGIILSDTGDGYYYCMLKKDEAALSDVFRNKALQGIEKVGEIKGLGFELMNSFLDCIKKDFFEAMQSKPDSDIIDLDPHGTTMSCSEDNGLRLFDETAQKNVIIKKSKILAGKDRTCDLRLSERFVSRIHAEFTLKDTYWLLRDCGSTNGTWLNNIKLIPGKKYVLHPDDVIDFANLKKFVFYKTQHHHNQPNEDEKQIAILEIGMKLFHDSDHKDETALKLIIAALINAPLYLPVTIDIEAMLGGADPTKLKPGDVLQPSKDVRMKVPTITANNTEFIPMFTSAEQVNKGSSVSTMRMYPQDYLPQVIQMGKDVVINPFGGSAFIYNLKIINELVWPIVQQNMQKGEEAPAKKSDEDLVGHVIDDRYELLNFLRSGGYYQVYLAKGESNHVCIIIVYDKNKPGMNDTIKNLLLQEPHLMMKFDHPAIPKLIDIIEDKEHLFIVSEYIEGELLSQLLSQRGPLSSEKAVALGIELAGVLQYLHSFHPPYIYQDMKPANVLVTSSGSIKLIDFGITMQYNPNAPDDSINSETIAWGTRAYAAPEQYGGGRRIDPRADIYGLGVTLHQCVTGIQPGLPPYVTLPICQINPALSKGLEYIICKCIELNPDNRYQSCAELIADLRNYQNLPPKKRLFRNLIGKKK